MAREYWCEVLSFYNKDTGDFERVLVCSDRLRYLVLDGVEAGYKRRGYTLVKAEQVGWVNRLLVAEAEE